MATNVIMGMYLDENGELTEGQDMNASSSEINAGDTSIKVVTPKELKTSFYLRGHIGTTPPSDTTILWIDTN